MRRTAAEASSSPAARRADLLLWIAVLLGPLAAGINTVVGYSVAHWVCDVNHKTTSFLVSGVDLVLCLAALCLSVVLHRQFADSPQDQPEQGRRAFMAGLGMLLSIFSLLVVIAGTLAAIILHPCD
jgi:hypothetical protein